MSCVIANRCYAEFLSKIHDQIVDRIGRNRVQTRRRFVIEDYLGIHAMARASPTLFFIPPESSDRHLVLDVLEPYERQLLCRDLSEFPCPTFLYAV